MSYLVVDKNQTIAGIQHDFNKCFPLLNICFFKSPHKPGQPSSRKNMYEKNLKLYEIRKKKKNGKIEIMNTMTVNTLEQEFENMFGLHMQVFRKSGKIWLETSATDSWTLEQQNTEGKNLQEQLKQEKENFDDHDIW